MKTLFAVLVTFLISLSTFAQQGINYKAILKDTNGNVLASTFMNVQFTIHQTTETGTIVYQEDHNYTTDANGLVILNMGTDSSPNVGVFADIDWSADKHFLQTTITYSGGTINFDATEFMAVPYAKHAETAANVFSGDYNDLINQPTTLPTGLEYLDETDDAIDNGGWRLVGRNPNDYENIGDGAVDLSYSSLGENLGATGEYSFAMGLNTLASGSLSTALGSNSIASGSKSTAMGWSTGATGENSTAMGYGNTASGISSTAMGSYNSASGDLSTSMGSTTTASGVTSTAMGRSTRARSAYETTIGSYNTDYTPISDTSFNENDRLFVIGNGISNSNRNNALTVLKNGNAKFDGEIQHTSTGEANMIPIAYGTVESTGDVLSGTGNFTASLDAGIITIDVNDHVLSATNSSCSVIPYSTAFRTSSIVHSGGDLKVYVFNSSGTLSATTFQFVIYKL
jgi:hypothetical protein